MSAVLYRWSRAASLAVALQSFTLAALAQLCPPGTPANNLCWLGGRVVHDPKLYLVYWGWGTPMNDPSNLVPITDTFARGIGATRALAIPTQYYDDYFPGNFYIPNTADIVKGVWYDNTNPLPADPWNGSYQIDDEAVRAAAFFGTATDPDAIYVVLIPPRAPQAPVGYCARHGFTNSGPNQILYIDFPYQTDIPGTCYGLGATKADHVSLVLLHEITEAYTDPVVTGQPPTSAWLDTNGAENADKCGWTGTRIALPRFSQSSPTQFPLSQSWSNGTNAGEIGACVDTFVSRIQYFTRGSDGKLYWRYKKNNYGSSIDWTLVPNHPAVTMTSDPGTVSWSDTRIDTFIVDSNQQVRHAYSDTGGASWAWDSWGKPAGTFVLVTAPSVVSLRRYSLDVFVTGCYSLFNCRLFHRIWEYDPPSNSYYDSGWVDRGAPLTTALSGPAATAGVLGQVRLDVWTTASATSLRHWYSNDRGATSAWDDWGAPSGGATLSGDPDAASWGPNRYDIFIKLSDGTVGHKWWDAGAHGWDNWGPVGGGVSSFPGIESLGDRRLRLVALVNGAFQQRTWDFGDRGWALLGGNYPGGPAVGSY